MIAGFIIPDVLELILTIIAIISAFVIGRRQISIQDTVELYASLGCFLGDNNVKVFIVHIQNAGTRMIYVDKYFFNNVEYVLDSQVLPSTYSQAQNNFYRITLPTNGEGYVEIDVVYHDLDSRSWITKIIASREGVLEWDIKTLARKPYLERNY